MKRAPLVVAVLLAPALAACIAPAAVEPKAAAGGFTDTAVFPGVYRFTANFSRVLVDGPLGILPDEVTVLASDVDGAAIQLAVVRPDVPPGTRWPIIVWITPYLDDLETVPVAHQDGDGGVRGAFLVENFVPHGYAVAAIAVRGSAGSGGCLDLFGPKENADVLAAIDWLVEQPWASGAVGAYGLSYEAGTQWALAAAAHPAVRTIVPVEGPNDARTAGTRNGTVTTASLLVEPFVVALYTVDDRAPGRIADAACPDFAARRALAAHEYATRGNGPLDEVYAERAFRQRIEEGYRGSIFVVQGFRDENIYPRNSYPWATSLDAHGIVTKHLLAPWGHHVPDAPESDYPRDDLAEILLHWYDRWLKDDGARDLGPRVQVADSDGAWRSEAGWPPADARPFELFLGSEGRLATASDAPASSVLVAPEPATATPVEAALGLAPVGVPDAAEAAFACLSCAAFRTGPLDRELRFAGLPQVHLSVTPLGPGGHLVAALLADGPDGPVHLSHGVMDLRFSQGDEPRAVEPGVTILAPLELEPTDAVVAAGSRLVLVVSQGGYGNMFFHHGGPLQTYPVRIEVGGDASVVRVLAFERVDGDPRFFTPPE